ncbi:FecCD family ABC transporter permease [Micromonospora sp. NBC_01813]|uniref:FecCD family ABC transporter permease n=1 Tax=Micromonospora sp. NBC_01813 TaxID=2975988 RepID=UPI002DDBB262|nr:iron ABC transporter permease [Micromonospora sp. NBC_01813]WSA10791.1 iron ABC transporter permease [Micromonospora sp. NBC_01813]
MTAAASPSPLDTGPAGPGDAPDRAGAGPGVGRGVAACAVLAAALVAAGLASVGSGQVPVPLDTVASILAFRLTAWGEVTWDATAEDIVFNLRLPRVLLAMIVGAALAVAGTLVQAIARNPLADPYLLGVSQGASVGAVAVIVLGTAAFGVTSTSVAAMLGAAVAFAVVAALGRAAGPDSVTRLLLAGVAVGYALQAVVNFLLLLADNPAKTSSALFWLAGSVGAARWSMLALPAVVTLLIGVIAVLAGQRLDALLLGDETATSLGVRPQVARGVFAMLAAVLTGTAVAVSGAIGFVGLVVPHAVRLVLGAAHRRLLPAAALAGALFLVVADLLARTVLAPRELPIGVVTGVVGAPVLAALLVRRRGRTG